MMERGKKEEKTEAAVITPLIILWVCCVAWQHVVAESAGVVVSTIVAWA